MDIKYNCLIVDDEVPAHKVIISHIEKLSYLIYKSSAYNGAEALNSLMNENFDIVFLDIEMPILNGLELVQSLPSKPAIIITTAYNHFAFDAFEHDAADYLLKPISLPRFIKAIEKAKLYCLSKQNKTRPTSIKIKANGEWISIDPDKITHIESIGNYIKIHIGQGRSLVVYETLKGISDKLQNENFIQIHKSFIANIQFATAMAPSKVQLGLLELPLGRKYELQVVNLFKKRI
ncbi:MAG TPA: LytTR family DNA-binding domain-containing protein [Flavobacterium sp.]|nr:LytTR family DNA-binding domain-containing protein [Flavobacterium sp.]